MINRSFGYSTDHKSPSDFRIRDYLLGEVLFNVLGINIYMLGRTSCIEINNIEELQVGLGSCSADTVNFDICNVFENCPKEKIIRDTKLVPQLVGNMFNLNNFSLNQCLYQKHKRLVEKRFPSIAHDMVRTLTDRLHNFRTSRKDKSDRFCMNRFGFIPNIDKTIEENMKLALEQRPAAVCFNECNNMSFHDLSRNKIATATLNLTSLLGLGAKFCPQTDQVSFKSTEAMITRLRKDIRTRHFVLNNNNLERNAAPPRLYRKNDKWEPNKVHGAIEGAMNRFELTLRREFGSLKQVKSTNLTMVQKNSLKFLRNQKELMILLSDKNLGPMVVHREDYVKAMMEQHLSNKKTCEIITKDEARAYLEVASRAFIDYVSMKDNRIDCNDLTCIKRCLDQDTRIPVMYGLGKLHKGKLNPPPYRPVVAIVGSQLHGIGRWVDSYLKELLPFCKTCIKNSDDVLGILRGFGLVFEDVFITTSDAEAMYPNINTEEGLAFVMVALDAFIFKTKPGWPRKQLLLAIRLLLKCNVFQFDDTYFRQIEGGAMGNPFTCMWAVVHFALVEKLLMESRFKANIVVLVRFIDDMFIIWREIKTQPRNWKDFQICLNKASNLNWGCEDLGDKVVFLDLEIWIDRKEQRFMFKPHAKEISLLLYLPPHSAHPKDAWKGMIHGLLSKYWRHCCRIEDYKNEVQQLYRGMINRGHCPAQLKQLFEEVSNSLEKRNSPVGTEVDSRIHLQCNSKLRAKDMSKIVLLHQEYHPKDVSRRTLQRIYRETCGPVFRDLLGIDRAMVAYHKSKNLKDLVIPSRMKDCIEPELKASTYAVGKTQAIKVQERVNEVVLSDGASMNMRNKVHKTFELVDRDIHCNSYKKKFVIKDREKEDD